MSEHLASASSSGGRKSTCRDCNRVVYVAMIDGKRVETDSELISVVVNGTSQRVFARRVHAEQCLRYQAEAARMKAKRRT